MDLVVILLRIMINILENGIMMLFQEKGLIRWAMELVLKDNGRIINEMVLESLRNRMVKFMRVSGKMIRNMVLVSL